MPSMGAFDSLCVLLFGEDSERARQLRALDRCDLLELTSSESLKAALASLKAHVLVVSGGKVPEEVLPAIRRPPIIWISSTSQPETADVLLSPAVGEVEFRECVELLGKRSQIIDELESLSGRLQSAFARHSWRGQTRWHGPHELLEMALTDPLTGLYSRRHFDTSLQQEFDRAQSRNQPLSLILMDLDQFKPVNDTWGHRAGDAVLTEVAARLRHSTRSTDIVCRHGGDEFAVIAPGTGVAAAALVADRLRAAISREPYRHDRQPIHVGCSAGVASLPECGAASPAELLLRADQALIAAKRAGGNRIHLSEGLVASEQSH